MAGTKLGSIKLETEVFNAGGSCKSWETLKVLVTTRVGAIEYGSITVSPREGNPGNVLHFNGGNSLNSIGLRNEGAEHYRWELPGMVKLTHTHGKPFFLNIAGFSVKEYMALARLGQESKVDALVVNLSCPNSEVDQVICFNPDLTQEIVFSVKNAVPDIPLIPKISPISDSTLLKKLAVIFSRMEVVAVEAVNTFPDCFDCDELGNPVISGRGLAGGGGDMLFHTGMGHVRQLRESLLPEIGVIGIGGIKSVLGAWKYLKGAGATAVALHTAARDPNPPYELTPHVFNEIITGLEDIERAEATIGTQRRHA